MTTTNPRPRPASTVPSTAAPLGFVSCLACACALAASTASAQPADGAGPGRSAEAPGRDLAPDMHPAAAMQPGPAVPSAASRDLAAQPITPRRRAAAAPLAFESSYQAGSPEAPPLTVPGRLEVPLPLAGAGRAFAREMREETLRSRRAGLFAYIPPELPELLEDDYIRDQRARVAERVIGASMEAAFGEALIGNVRKQHGLRLTPTVSRVNVESGLKIDASPTWTWRRTTPRTGMRVDLPIGPSNFRVHAWKDLRGTNTTPMRMGTALSVDPFDQSVSCGFSFEF